MIFELPIVTSESTSIIEICKVVLDSDNITANLFKIESEDTEIFLKTIYKHPLKFKDNGERYQWINEQEVVDWILGKGYSEKDSQ
jgi:hypothetical protein